MRQFYAVSEVAARFEVTSQTVRNWIAAGRLLSVQPTPGGRYKIHAQALLAFEQNSANAITSTLPGQPIASELERVVQAIVTAVQPEAVILFGSRARGGFGADSDLDLAILAPDGVARRRVAMRAYESLAAVADRSVAVDIVVLTPSIMAAERDLAGSIARQVSREGVALYGSSAALA